MYNFSDDRITMDTADGPRALTNFTAEITEEITYIDGPVSIKHLTIAGKTAKEKFPPHTIPANDFRKMNWVAQAWGSVPVILAEPSAEKHIANAIQLTSTPRKRTIRTHIGWNEEYTEYFASNGSITEKGFKPGATTKVPADLSRYELSTGAAKTSMRKSLQLLRLIDPSLAWPLLAATYRPIFGPTDFAVHIAGRTGTYKSELCSIIQCHYGSQMTARALPCSWSSTANALEHLAYRAKNAICVIDDFVPNGTTWQVRALNKTADQLFRGQGNQSGRARMTDIGSANVTYYPRGIILSTGEDLPTGHSCRGRMMIIEISPGDVNLPVLSNMQKARQELQNAMGNVIMWTASDPDQRQKLQDTALTLRDKYLDRGHTRTPGMIGQLIATAWALMDYCQIVGVLDKDKAEKGKAEAERAIAERGTQQKQYLQDADPVQNFLDGIRSTFAGQIGHVRTINGGWPNDPELYGWAEEPTSTVRQFTPRGRQIGWISEENEELYIDLATALPVVKKVTEVPIAATTLAKRLREAGALTRTDVSRQRIPVRVTCERHQRTVLSIDLNRIYEAD